MSNFSEEDIEAVWSKATVVSNNDPNTYRKDFAGAWISRKQYGKEGDHGWEIDHQFPESLGGGNEPENLQPMHWSNNRKKSHDFPQFNTDITSDGVKNVEKIKPWKFSAAEIAIFKKLYPDNKELKKL